MPAPCSSRRAACSHAASHSESNSRCPTGPRASRFAAHGGIIVTSSLREAMELANSAAPEHLVIDDERLAKQGEERRLVFVGTWSAQVAGDYADWFEPRAPTAGAARVRGGLSAGDLVRQITVQRLTQGGCAASPSVVSPWHAQKGSRARAVHRGRCGPRSGPVCEIHHADSGLSRVRRGAAAAPQ